MARLSTTYPFTCVTCEVEIVGPATFHLGLPFCCAGCVAGGPCTCSYDRDPVAHAQFRDDRETAHATNHHLGEPVSTREPVAQH